MKKYNALVCSEFDQNKWRWIENKLQDSVELEFYFTSGMGSSLKKMCSRIFTCAQSVVKAKKADALVSHGPYIAFWVSLFHWLFNSDTQHVVYSFNFAELPSGFAKIRFGWAFRRIDKLVVSSAMEKELYSNYFGVELSRIDVVLWGVSKPDFITTDLEGVPDVFISSVGGNARDYQTFMAAMALLPDIPAVAIMRPNNLIGLNVPDNVKVMVNTTKDVAMSVIEQSSFSVLPLVSTETPCGHVTIVASMYLDTPVVCSRSTGVDDYILHGETGLICEQGDVIDMVQKIDSLWSSASLNEKLANNSLIFVNKHCSEKNYRDHFMSFLENN